MRLSRNHGGLIVNASLSFLSTLMIKVGARTFNSFSTVSEQESASSLATTPLWNDCCRAMALGVEYFVVKPPKNNAQAPSINERCLSQGC